MTKSFHTYFTIDDLPSQALSSMQFFIVVAIASLTLFALCIYFRKQIKYENIQIITWSLFSIGILSTCTIIYWSISLKSGNTTPFERLKRQNNFFVVEGYIRDFNIKIEDRRGGVHRTIESFSIDSVHFEYNDFPMAAFNSFHKTRRLGGIIDNGLYARISYVDNFNEHIISKIEIAN